MIAEISTALTALKTATDIAKGINSLNSEVEIKSKTSEFLNVILDLQNAMLALQSTVADLQSENTSLKNEIDELRRNATESGSLKFEDKVYWKEEDGTPFCPTCWENNKKLIHLDGDGIPFEGVVTWYCSICKYDFDINSC